MSPRRPSPHPPVELHEPGTERGAWSPGPCPTPGSGVQPRPQGDPCDILAALALCPTRPGSRGVPGVLSRQRPGATWFPAGKPGKGCGRSSVPLPGS